VSLGAAVALIVALAGAIIVACYDVPTPDCGFLCGPGGACPDDYTCADNQRCRRNAAPASLVCPNPDADLPDGRDAAVDGAVDAPPDAPTDATIDAPGDAMPDAPGDATIEAPPDAPPDATSDATIDAPPDAPP
jgi:hypothetical protein